MTLQRYNTDYYDISAIGGANVATSFGPDAAAASTGVPIPAASGYSCGTAGATQAQGTLPGADWSMATHVNDPVVSGGTQPYSVSSQTAATPSTAYYHFISSITPREAPGCTSNGNCPTSGHVCGYDAAAVNRGDSSDYQTSCGTHLSWLSASQTWALNNTATNTAPFPFSGSYNTAAGATIQVNQLFSCTAPTASGYNTSNSDATQTCGCTDWGEASLGGGPPGDAPFASRIASPSTACATRNPLWVSKVLPTLAWMKKACPTCYTYPFDDMSSTFQCSNQASSSSGTNTVPYLITFGGDIPGQ